MTQIATKFWPLASDLAKFAENKLKSTVCGLCGVFGFVLARLGFIVVALTHFMAHNEEWIVNSRQQQQYNPNHKYYNNN